MAEHSALATNRFDGFAAKIMTYDLRLMFEWGGGYLWCDNDAARAAFDVGSIEDRLPLSESLRKKLDDLSRLHDVALNWEYPPDPGPWSREEYAAFEDAVCQVLPLLREELGADFSVRYDRLGGYEEATSSPPSKPSEM